MYIYEAIQTQESLLPYNLLIFLAFYSCVCLCHLLLRKLSTFLLLRAAKDLHKKPFLDYYIYEASPSYHIKHPKFPTQNPKLKLTPVPFLSLFVPQFFL